MQITVDGDTSTNDTVLGLTSGAAGNAKITDPRSEEAAQLEVAVTALLQVGLFFQQKPSLFFKSPCCKGVVLLAKLCLIVESCPAMLHL